MATLDPNLAAAWGVAIFATALNKAPADVRKTLESGHCIIFALEDPLTAAAAGAAAAAAAGTAAAWTRDFVADASGDFFGQGQEGERLEVSHWNI